MLVGAAPLKHDWCVMVVWLNDALFEHSRAHALQFHRVGEAELSDLRHLCERHVLACLFICSFFVFFLFFRKRRRFAYFERKATIFHSLLSDVPHVPRHALSPVP